MLLGYEHNLTGDIKIPDLDITSGFYGLKLWLP